MASMLDYQTKIIKKETEKKRKEKRKNDSDFTYTTIEEAKSTDGSKVPIPTPRTTLMEPMTMPTAVYKKKEVAVGTMPAIQ